MLIPSPLLLAGVLAAWASFDTAHAATSFGSWRINGERKLLGSSFGLIGVNATYDYVVSVLLYVAASVSY